jgi:hypothetical protein
MELFYVVANIYILEHYATLQNQSMCNLSLFAPKYLVEYEEEKNTVGKTYVMWQHHHGFVANQGQIYNKVLLVLWPWEPVNIPEFHFPY